MQTRTYTLLVTVTDDGCAPVFNPIILAAAVQGALEGGCRFVLDSSQVRALAGDPLIRATVGEHILTPVSSAQVDAFTGDRVECKPGTVGATAATGVGARKQLHRALRVGA